METKGPSMIINIFRSVQSLRWGGGAGGGCSKLRQTHSLLSPGLIAIFLITFANLKNSLANPSREFSMLLKAS